MKIDLEQYKILQDIYDYFNSCFFDNQLPEIVFIINYRKNQSNLGYFHPTKLKQGDKLMSIISLNPDRFDRENIEIIATLVHEMCHVWHFYCCEKKLKSNGYHDRLWGQKMESIGLTPSNTGEPGGKKTGRNIHHIIEKNGQFEIKAKQFIAKHNNIFLFQGIANLKEKSVANRNKIKYTCSCGIKLYSQPDLEAICKKCNTDFTSYE